MLALVLLAALVDAPLLPAITPFGWLVALWLAAGIGAYLLTAEAIQQRGIPLPAAD